VDDFNVYLIRLIPVDDDEDAGPLSLATQDSRTRSVERLVAGVAVALDPGSLRHARRTASR
jgi:hypothetical protein